MNFAPTPIYKYNKLSPFDILRQKGPNVGLALNPDIDPQDSLGRLVLWAATSGYSLLGAPVSDIPIARDITSDRIGNPA